MLSNVDTAMFEQVELVDSSREATLLSSPPRASQPSPTERLWKTNRAPLRVKKLETKEEIGAHRSLWDWPGTRDSDVDLFLHFSEARSEEIGARVFVAYRGDAPEAMLMARLEVQAIPMRLGLLNLRTPRLRVLDIIYGGMRGRINKDTTEVLVKAVLDSLRTGQADIAIFEPLKTNSPLWEALQTLPGRLERGFAGTHHNHYRMPLPRNSRQLQELIPGHQRRDYLRKGRKLVRDFSGDVFHRWFSEPSPEMYRDLEYVAERSFQRGMGVGFRDTPELRGCWDLVASKGWLRACVLYAGGKPSAFWTGVACSGTLWCDYMAYDRELASYSPGMYLALQSFGELCDTRMEHGIREISLGPGDSRLKSQLGCSCEQEKSVYLYPPTIVGLGLNAMLSGVFAADDAARSWLTQTNSLAKAARRIRREHAIRTLGCYRTGELRS